MENFLLESIEETEDTQVLNLIKTLLKKELFALVEDGRKYCSINYSKSISFISEIIVETYQLVDILFRF